jgi:GT2 family glycosyltransferase
MSPAADLSRGQPTGHVPAWPRRRPVVSAVIVAHDGARWLPRLLTTLEGQTRLPNRLVAVDTGSRDDTGDLLTRALGPEAVVTTGRDVGFGQAIATGLAALDDRAVREGWLDGRDNGRERGGEHWVWVLHDDMQLDPYALENLLAAVERDGELCLVGPKVREWPQRRRLLEVGLTVTGTARRVTGVDPGEYDQGQHDRLRQTLAVGSAGMLVRRSTWDQLRGFDPALPLFSDDLDLGWRAARSGMRAAVAPDAVVFHAEAASRGQRSIDAAHGIPPRLARPRRLARQHAMYTVLANCRGPVVPFVAVRLLLGSMLRALGLLLLKAPGEAWDEIRAAGAVLGHPSRVWRGRRRRRSTRRRGRVRHLLAPWWAPYGQGLELTGQLVAEALQGIGERRRGGSDVETGPVAEEAESLEVGPGPVTWLLSRPMGVAVAVLVLLSLVAGPSLFGAGLLQGGALLPTPPSAGDWWRTFVESWHPVAQGSDTAAPPYVAVLGALGSLLLAKSWLVVDLLFAMAVPLTALSGYVLVRRVVDSRPVAVWAAVTYGLLPVLTGAVAQGRLGAVAGGMVAPLLASCALGISTAPTVQGRWRAAVGSGLLLAVLASFVPMTLPVAVVLAVVAWPAPGRDRSLLLRLTAVLATAVLLLLPWLLELGVDVTGWSLAEAGWEHGLAPASPTSRLDLVLGRPGGPGQAPGWLTAGLMLAALVALLRTDRRGVVLRAWAVGLAALALAVLQQRSGAWPGFALELMLGAAVVAAAAVADGVLHRLGGASFSWRQPLFGVVAVVTMLTPVLAAGWWLLAAGPGLLHRERPLPLPAFMADAQRSATAPRTLVLSGAGNDLSVHLSRGPGLYLGQDAVAPPHPPGLAALTARLVTEPSPEDVSSLATYGVGSVLLTAGDGAQISALDGAPGLVRSSAGAMSGAAAWRLDGDAGPVRLEDHGTGPAGVIDARVLPSEAGSVHTRVDRAGSAPGPRTLTLGERADSGWEATLDGDSLHPRTLGGADGWTQAFTLPAGGGDLVVEHQGARPWWLGEQAVVLVLALVMVAPGRRRTDEQY